MSKHANAVRDALAERVSALMKQDLLPERVHGLLGEALFESDVIAAATAAARALLEAEATKDACKGAEDALRAALVEVFEETGASGLHLPGHTISLVSGKPGFAVTDPAAISPELRRSEPDRSLIQKAINAGQDVPGVSVTNGRPHLQIRANTKGTKA